MTAYLAQYAVSILPEPDLLVSEWADRHRVLDQAASSEPGRWRTSRTPYLREIMDCLSATRPEQVVVFRKGAQIGATEAGNNWMGYVIHHAPGPMLYVTPTVELAKRASKSRLAPMLAAVPELALKVSSPRARDTGNTLFQKDFVGGTLILTGANSAVGLRSMPARYLFLDEASAYPADLDGEGDPIDLALRRTATFRRNRKVFIVSTPTLAGVDAIEPFYEQSDKREYFVPCPDCGEFQTIEWERLQWDKATPDQVALACQHCGSLIDESAKHVMLPRGEWRATQEGNGHSVGFHLSSLYSPIGWYSWRDAVRDWLASEGSAEKRKTFVNTVLGQPWKEIGESVDAHPLMARAEDYPAEAPEGIGLLTAGIDVQADRIELEVVGWGAGEESWSVDYRILPGVTAQPEVWDDLAEALRQTYRHARGADLSIAAAGLDTGYLPRMGYEFCLRFGSATVWPLKGVEGARPVVENVLQRARRLANRQGKRIRPQLVGVDEAKSILYRRLAKVVAPGPGFCHFPKDRPEEWYLQLTAEQLMTAVSNGVPVRRWTRLRPRNESLDCRVYAYAALKLLAPDLDVAARKMAAWEKPAPNFASLPLPGQRREPIGHRPPRPKL